MSGDDPDDDQDPDDDAVTRWIAHLRDGRRVAVMVERSGTDSWRPHPDWCAVARWPDGASLRLSPRTNAHEALLEARRLFCDPDAENHAFACEELLPDGRRTRRELQAELARLRADLAREAESG
jgi:hypothetical protein